MSMNIIVGMTNNAFKVQSNVWNTIDSWCQNMPIIFALQTVIDPIYVPVHSCKYLYFTKDDSSIHKSNDRLIRVAKARDQQRNWMLPAIKDHFYSSRRILWTIGIKKINMFWTNTLP